MIVSTIIRTYNRGYIIGEALESALSQTHQDLEIIVVDDGSTDNTPEIVRSFKSAKVRYVRHERNRGVAVAGNTGIEAATGEVVALLDSDDLWKPHKLARQVMFLQQHPAVDVVFSDVELLDGEVRLPSTMSFMQCFPQLLAVKKQCDTYVLERREMYLCLLQEVPIKTNSVMFRREALNRVGTFDENSQSGEDWDLFLRLSRSASFGYIREALAIQRRLPDSTHTRYREQDKVFLLGRFLAEKQLLHSDPEALAAVNRGIANHCSNLAYHYLYSGQRRKAVSVYLQGFSETRECGFLLGAVSTAMPLGVRNSLRSVVRGGS